MFRCFSRDESYVPVGFTSPAIEVSDVTLMNSAQWQVFADGCA